jgi:hypothetical protein
MFSEFHHALGALAYAEQRGAAGVRFDFRSALYVDPAKGPNWWRYFFANDQAVIRNGRPRGEVHLTARLAKYGRYGGFCDIVNGSTPYLYPMTRGIALPELNRLFRQYIGLRDDVRSEAEAISAALLDRSRFIVGVHYRGTDSNERAIAGLNDYRREPVAYSVYADEVRRVLSTAGARSAAGDARGAADGARGDAAGARGGAAGARGFSRAFTPYQLVVASDEREFLDFMRREFGSDQVVFVEDAPRSHAGGPAIHFDRTLGSNYEKGKAGLIDCLLLSSADYLIKGRSNLSDASLVFNPALPYSLCLR